MKVIIAGSRGIIDYNIVCKAVENSSFDISEIVSGGAKGVDKLGEQYAQDNNISLKIFKADWDNIDAPGAVVKQGQYGLYNVRAGFERNEKMAAYADALVAIWDGKSKGTKHMIDYMGRLNKIVYIHQIGEKNG